MKDVIEKMEDGKDKELMKILEGGAKPFLRKCDGYARKIDEDKEISYKDYNEQELTLKVPAGSYLVIGENGNCPKIVTSEDFESKNKFIGGESEPKPRKEKGPSLGMEMAANSNPEY